MNSIKKYGQGFSIVEVMISMVVGLLILAGILSVYLSNSQSFRFNSQMARIQENGRFALSILENDIRMAAYMGCTKMTLDEDGYTPKFELGASVTSIVVDDEDEQLLQGVKGDASNLTIYGVPKEGAGAYVHSTCGGDPVIDATACPNDGTEICGEIGKVEYKFDDDALTRDGKVLVDNVEEFNLKYGVDYSATDGMTETITWYDDYPSGAAEKLRVTAVQVELKLVSVEDVLEMAGPEGDRKLHRTFRSTITLRNKVPNGYGKCDGGTNESSRCGEESST